MAKRKETLELENVLYNMCKKKRIYGCEEVTIGFYRNGHGNEIVDFCTMDSKGVLRCYEIKVTLSDLKSKAKKSWYGHYNYLFVTEALYEKIEEKLNDYIPEYVGVAVPSLYSWSDGIEVRRKAKKQNICQEQEVMLKESMIRSMSYKMQHLREASDLKYVSELKGSLRRCEKDKINLSKKVISLGFIIQKTERILRRYYNKDICLEEFVDSLENKKAVLPENINLTLNERGQRINGIIKEDIEEI